MPRDIEAARSSREDFIKQQEGKARRRKPTRARVDLKKIRGTLFAKRNVNLAIRESALRKHQMVITYRKTTTKDTKKYVVAPYSYRFKKLKVGRRKMLFAYDMDSKHIKGFALREIQKVALSDRRFTPKWPIEIK